METLAITYWNELISPLFDAAQQVLILPDKGEGCFLSTAQMTVYQKAMLLKEYKTDVVICGAISQVAQNLLESRDIVVVSWICGRVDNAVDAYKKGEQQLRKLFMPGYRCRKARGQGKCNRYNSSDFNGNVRGSL